MDFKFINKKIIINYKTSNDKLYIIGDFENVILYVNYLNLAVSPDPNELNSLEKKLLNILHKDKVVSIYVITPKHAKIINQYLFSKFK